MWLTTSNQELSDNCWIHIIFNAVMSRRSHVSRLLEMKTNMSNSQQQLLCSNRNKSPWSDNKQLIQQSWGDTGWHHGRFASYTKDLDISKRFSLCPTSSNRKAFEISEHLHLQRGFLAVFVSLFFPGERGRGEMLEKILGMAAGGKTGSRLILAFWPTRSQPKSLFSSSKHGKFRV